MPRSFGEPLTRLRAVPILESGEGLADPCEMSSRIIFAKEHPRLGDRKRTPKVRRRVAEMLAESAERLPEGLSLIIIEGYRPIESQRFLYERMRTEFAEKNPHWPKSTLMRKTNTMTAPPDDKCPPPHITGAAVDLTIVENGTLEWIDMISPYEMGPAAAPMAVRGLSETARKNRKILADALMPSGITNYIGEWWHWSYGDSGWALRTGAPHAIYGRLDNPEI